MSEVPQQCRGVARTRPLEANNLKGRLFLPQLSANLVTCRHQGYYHIDDKVHCHCYNFTQIWKEPLPGCSELARETMQRMRPQAKRWWPLAPLLKTTPHSTPVPHCLSCPSPRKPSSVLQILPGGFSRPLQLPFPIPMTLVHGPDNRGPSYQQVNTHYEKLGIFPRPSTFIPTCMLGSTRTGKG